MKWSPNAKHTKALISRRAPATAMAGRLFCQTHGLLRRPWLLGYARHLHWRSPAGRHGQTIARASQRQRVVLACDGKTCATVMPRPLARSFGGELALNCSHQPETRRVKECYAFNCLRTSSSYFLHCPATVADAGGGGGGVLSTRHSTTVVRGGGATTSAEPLEQADEQLKSASDAGCVLPCGCVSSRGPVGTFYFREAASYGWQAGGPGDELAQAQHRLR